MNFHAFAAKLQQRRVLHSSATWAIWAMHDAHERQQEEENIIQDAFILGAAQWIFWYGQCLFEHVLSPGDVSSDDLRAWTPGPLYNGQANLSIDRWRFWRDGFQSASTLKEADESTLAQERRAVAGEATLIMDAIERTLSFGSLKRVLD